jgi:hypothetical protein
MQHHPNLCNLFFISLLPFFPGLHAQQLNSDLKTELTKGLAQEKELRSEIAMRGTDPRRAIQSQTMRSLEDRVPLW